MRTIVKSFGAEDLALRAQAFDIAWKIYAHACSFKAKWRDKITRIQRGSHA
jgi:hypothetical protein